jgi:gas vesicle protein
MNQRFLIGILGGVVAGFFLGWFLRPQPSSGIPEVTSARVAQLEAELQSKTSQLERLTKPAIKPPVAAKTEASETRAVATQAKARAEAAGNRREVMQQQFQEKQKLKLDERIAALRARLNLTDEQAAAIREIMEKNPQGPEAMMMSAMAGGEADKARLVVDFLRPGEKSAELTGKITALLTPEQQEAFTAFRQEQRTNDIEIKTGKELARLQSSLTLSPEQKDKAFAVLSAMAEQEYDTPVSPIASLMVQQIENQRDGAGAKALQPHIEEIKAAGDLARQRREQRVEAMREILSPEQVSLYESQQKQSSMSEVLDGFGEMSGALLMGLPHPK